jgi:steroid delta-isomerase-like uncharacterized protein
MPDEIAEPAPPFALDALVDAWEAAWTGRDPAAFAPLCDPGVQYEDPLTGAPLIGVEELAGHAELLWQGFPDVRVERAGERLSDDAGRFLAAPCKLAGTHRGPLDSLPASDRFLVVHGVVYGELRRGRLLRVRAFFDLYDAAVQLGVLPTHGTVGEKALLMLRGFGLRSRGG